MISKQGCQLFLKQTPHNYIGRHCFRQTEALFSPALTVLKKKSLVGGDFVYRPNEGAA